MYKAEQMFPFLTKMAVKCDRTDRLENVQGSVVDIVVFFR